MSKKTPSPHRETIWEFEHRLKEEAKELIILMHAREKSEQIKNDQKKPKKL